MLILTGPCEVSFVHHYWWAGLQNSQIRATSHTTFGEIFSGKYYGIVTYQTEITTSVCSGLDVA